MSYIIPIIVCLTAVIGIVIAVISSVLYRKHLDRVVSGEERGTHTKVAEPLSVIKTVVICVLAIWVAISMMTISGMNRKIDELAQQIDSRYASINAGLASIGTRLDEADSLAKDISYEFRNIDTKARTVDMDMKITLKSYDKDTSVYIYLGDKETELSLTDKGKFEGTVKAELFTLYEDFPVMKVVNGDVAATEELDDCPAGYFAIFCMPVLIDTACDYSMHFSGSSMAVTGRISVVQDDGKVPGLTFSSAEIRFISGSEVLGTIPLEFTDGAAEDVPLDFEVPFEENQPFRMDLVTKTAEGWTVSQTVSVYDWDENSNTLIAGYDNMTVTDENGVILFGVSDAN